MCLPVSFVNVLKAPFLQNSSGRLFLRLENLKVGGSSKDRRTYPLDLFAFLCKKKEKKYGLYCSFDGIWDANMFLKSCNSRILINKKTP